jgi:hypothetical protein
MEGLIDGVLPPEPETLQLVRCESERLGRLVADIERISRLEAGAELIRPRAVPARELVWQATAAMRPRFEEKGVVLMVDAPDDVNAFVDPDKTVQVLTNLLQNALRYTAGGGDARVAVTPDEGQLLFSVSDSATYPTYSNASTGRTGPARRPGEGRGLASLLSRRSSSRCMGGFGQKACLVRAVSSFSRYRGLRRNRPLQSADFSQMRLRGLAAGGDEAAAAPERSRLKSLRLSFRDADRRLTPRSHSPGIILACSCHTNPEETSWHSMRFE